MLREEGIGWALVAPGAGPASLPAGASLVVDGADLDLYRLAPPEAAPPLTGVVPVAAGFAVAGMVLLVAAASAARSRRAGHESDTPSTGDSAAGATGW